MTLQLKDYQKKAANFIAKNIRDNLWSASKQNEYEANILKAITGAGKTVILSDVINQIDSENKHDYCIFWLSSFPEINEQSKLKIQSYYPHLSSKLVTLDSGNYSHGLTAGNIYFLNYAKLSKNSNMVKKGADFGNITFWDLNFKDQKIIFVVDEAHIGSTLSPKTINENKTILNTMISTIKPKFVVGASATPEYFKEFIEDINLGNNIHIKSDIYTVHIKDVCDSGMIKNKLTNVSFKTNPTIAQSFNAALFLDALSEYEKLCIYWENEIKTSKRPVFLIQVDDNFEQNNTDIQVMLDCLFIQTNSPYIQPNLLFHTFPDIKLKGFDSKKRVYDIPGIKPNNILTTSEARFIIFKENLSTGWDCPTAEVLFSMKTQHKGSSIIQTIGRILRNPFVNEPLINDIHHDVISSVYFYTPLFNQKIINEIINEFGIDVTQTEHGTPNSNITLIPDVEIILKPGIEEYFTNNQVTHYNFLYPKQTLMSKINIFKMTHINNQNITLESIIKNIFSSLSLKHSTVSDWYMEFNNYMTIGLDRYSIDIYKMEMYETELRKDKAINQSLRAKLDFDIITSNVQDYLSEVPALDTFFAKQWRLATTNLKEFDLFFSSTLGIPNLKTIVSDIIKNNNYQIDDNRKGYIILLKYLFSKHDNILSQLEEALDNYIQIDKNNPTHFKPKGYDSICVDKWNTWTFTDTNSSKIKNNDSNKLDFLVVESKIGYQDTNVPAVSKQAMHLNELENKFVENYIIPQDFDYWWRNSAGSDGLGILYTKSSGEEALYRPDFIGIKDNALFILEGKARRDDWIEKYKGLLNWVTEQKKNKFVRDIHHVWCFEVGQAKHKKIYLVKNAQLPLINLLEASLDFDDLVKSSITKPSLGIVTLLS